MTDKLNASDDQAMDTEASETSETVVDEPQEPTEELPREETSEAPTGAPTPREAKVADAKNRSLRSALQSTSVAVFVAVVLACAQFLRGTDVAHLDWKALAAVAVAAAGTPLAAFLHRMLGE